MRKIDIGTIREPVRRSIVRDRRQNARGRHRLD
jgi:hypothetical protein